MTEQHDRETDDGEIYLYKYWLALKRRWVFLASLVVIAVGATAVITRQMPKTYRVSATIIAGRMGSVGNNQTESLAATDDIVELIKEDSFVGKIIDSLGLDKKQYSPKLSNGLKAQARKGGELVYISYDTVDPETGKKIVSTLIDQIKKMFDPRAAKSQRIFDADILGLREAINVAKLEQKKANTDIESLSQQIETAKEKAGIDITIKEKEKEGANGQIKHLDDRIASLQAAKDRLNKSLTMLEANTQDLVKGKTEVIGNPGTTDTFSRILFANDLQQNIAFINTTYDRLQSCDMEINKAQDDIQQLKTKLAVLDESIKQLTLQKEADIKGFQQEIQQLALRRDEEIPGKAKEKEAEINRLAAEKDGIESIRAVSEPDYIDIPVSPKMTANLAAAGVISILLGSAIALVRGRREWL